MKAVLEDTFQRRLVRVRESDTLEDYLMQEYLNLSIQRAELLRRIGELESHHHDDLYWYRRFRELEQGKG